MKHSAFLLLALATLLTHVAQAKPGALPENRDLATEIIAIEVKLDDQLNPPGPMMAQKMMNQVDKLTYLMQKTDPDGYETLRATMVEKAPTLEVFLRWATPDEIADDAGLTDADLRQQMLDHSALGGKSLINITVHLGTQTMDAQGGGLNIVRHRIASARPGYVTPKGCRHPTLLEKSHWSRKYNAPMPNSVFFVGGVALHQGPIGIRSHGCVHLTAQDSANVFRAVSAAGKGNTQICVVR